MSPPPAARSAATRLVPVWSDTAWPVLAGAVAGAGLLAAWELIGPLRFCLTVGLLALLVGVTLACFDADSGCGFRHPVALVCAVPLAIEAVVGLAELLPVAGWLVVLGVGVTSPVVLGRLTPRVRTRHEPESPVPRGDQQAVDREFARIVAEFD